MAKITTPQKNGSVGLSTFVSSPYGVIERRRIVPRNPRTLVQQCHRGFLKAVAAQWRGLTDAQRAGWRALAGQLPGHLHGCQAYIKVNVTRRDCGLPEVPVAPAPPAFGILICTGLVADSTPLVKLTGVTATVAPDVFVLEACPPVSQGIQCPGKSFRQFLVVPGHAGPGADLDLTAAYTARFKAPQAGERIFVRISAMKDGFKDAPLQFDAIVAAHAA